MVHYLFSSVFNSIKYNKFCFLKTFQLIICIVKGRKTGSQHSRKRNETLREEEFRMSKLALIIVSIILAVVADDTNDIVAQINSVQNLWTAAPNDITKKGIEYMRKIAGTKIPESPNSLGLPIVSDMVKNIPKSFDARTAWPKCPTIKSIKDQGYCGSCWAVATVTAASDRLCIKTHGKLKRNLSIQNLLSCCTTCVDPGTAGCDGGYPDKAWNYVKSSGIVTGGDYGSKEGCYPYEIEPTDSSENLENSENYYTPPCHQKCTNEHYTHSFRQDKHYGKTSYLVAAKEAAIQTDIMKNGPVEAAFTVYRDFYYYSGGVYVRTSSSALGGHAVRVIGWGVENGVKYWLVANSWNTTWGENGLFKIRRGTDECGFESFITAGLIKK